MKNESQRKNDKFDMKLESFQNFALIFVLQLQRPN